MNARKVSKRSWSLEKFTASVKAECKRLNVKPGSTASIKKLYDDGATVRYAASTFGPAPTK